MKLKIIVCAILMLLTAAKLSAQKYQYTYDNAGNRINVLLYKSAETTSIPDSIIERENNVEFKLYPNPTKGQIVIETKGIATGTKMVCFIWNQAGQLVTQQIVEDVNTIRYDMSNRANGLYILRLQYGENQKTWNVLKQ